MPEAVPMAMPDNKAGVLPLPPAVDEVCEPWPPWPVAPPTESRGESRNSVQCSLPGCAALKPALKYCAPISLLLQC